METRHPTWFYVALVVCAALFASTVAYRQVLDREHWQLRSNAQEATAFNPRTAVLCEEDKSSKVGICTNLRTGEVVESYDQSPHGRIQRAIVEVDRERRRRKGLVLALGAVLLAGPAAYFFVSYRRAKAEGMTARPISAEELYELSIPVSSALEDAAVERQDLPRGEDDAAYQILAENPVPVDSAP